MCVSLSIDVSLLTLNNKGLLCAVCHAQMRVSVPVSMPMQLKLRFHTDTRKINSDRELLMETSTHRITIFPILVTMASAACVYDTAVPAFFLSFSTF